MQAISWPARKKWTRNHLRKVFKRQAVVAGNYSMSFEDYLAYTDASRDDMPLYLFDSKFAQKAPQLAADYKVNIPAVQPPPTLRHESVHELMPTIHRCLRGAAGIWRSSQALICKARMYCIQVQVPEQFPEDLFSVLGESARPDYRWLIMGPERSGSSFHKDPNATSAWNAVVKGSKKWVLFPPHVTPPGQFLAKVPTC